MTTLWGAARAGQATEAARTAARARRLMGNPLGLGRSLRPLYDKSSLACRIPLTCARTDFENSFCTPLPQGERVLLSLAQTTIRSSNDNRASSAGRPSPLVGEGCSARSV